MGPMIGRRIRQARVAAGMTQDEVVAALPGRGLKLTKAGLSKYERGGSVPKPATLRGLANVFGVPTDFFMSEPVVEVEWLAFRKASGLGKSAQERIKTLAAAQVEGFVSLRQALEPKWEQPRVSRSRVQTPEQAEATAEGLRERWHLGLQPIESVTSTIEDAGGIVVEANDSDALFHGLAGWAAGSTPVVVVNSAASDDRRRFSLAHELGHLFMEVEECDSKTEEKLAHRFAAAFLVPERTVKRELGEKRRHLDFQELAMLKLKHGLSMQAWIIRASDLGIVEQAHARTLFAEFSARGWRREEPVKFEGQERPTRLRQLTVRALAEGLLSAAQAKRLCPDVVHDSADARAVAPGSMDARALVKLPKEERERFLEQAAALTQVDYETAGGALTGFDALGEEDHRDEPLED